MQILLSEKAVTVYEILFILILIIILVVQHRKRKDALERRRISNKDGMNSLKKC